MKRIIFSTALAIGLAFALPVLAAPAGSAEVATSGVQVGGLGTSAAFGHASNFTTAGTANLPGHTASTGFTTTTAFGASTGMAGFSAFGTGYSNAFADR